jgi:hypothetical protein
MVGWKGLFCLKCKKMIVGLAIDALEIFIMLIVVH